MTSPNPVADPDTYANYWLMCSECSMAGPKRETLEQTVRAAIQHGWKVKNALGPGPIVAYCPECKEGL